MTRFQAQKTGNRKQETELVIMAELQNCRTAELLLAELTLTINCSRILAPTTAAAIAHEETQKK